MNQTGGRKSQMQSQGGTRKREDVQVQHVLNPDNYVEKPRPNFYNVIKLIRESKVRFILIYELKIKHPQQSTKRVLYVAKLNEAEMKGEVESKIHNLSILNFNSSNRGHAELL